MERVSAGVLVVALTLQLCVVTVASANCEQFSRCGACEAYDECAWRYTPTLGEQQVGETNNTANGKPVNSTAESIKAVVNGTVDENSPQPNSTEIMASANAEMGEKYRTEAPHGKCVSTNPTTPPLRNVGLGFCGQNIKPSVPDYGATMLIFDRSMGTCLQGEGPVDLCGDRGVELMVKMVSATADYHPVESCRARFGSLKKIVNENGGLKQSWDDFRRRYWDWRTTTQGCMDAGAGLEYLGRSEKRKHAYGDYIGKYGNVCGAGANNPNGRSRNPNKCSIWVLMHTLAANWARDENGMKEHGNLLKIIVPVVADVVPCIFCRIHWKLLWGLVTKDQGKVILADVEKDVGDAAVAPLEVPNPHPKTTANVTAEGISGNGTQTNANDTTSGVTGSASNDTTVAATAEEAGEPANSQMLALLEKQHVIEILSPLADPCCVLKPQNKVDVKDIVDGMVRGGEKTADDVLVAALNGDDVTSDQVLLALHRVHSLASSSSNSRWSNVTFPSGGLCAVTVGLEKKDCTNQAGDLVAALLGLYDVSEIPDFFDLSHPNIQAPAPQAAGGAMGPMMGGPMMGGPMMGGIGMMPMNGGMAMMPMMMNSMMPGMNMMQPGMGMGMGMGMTPLFDEATQRNDEGSEDYTPALSEYSPPAISDADTPAEYGNEVYSGVYGGGEVGAPVDTQ